MAKKVVRVEDTKETKKEAKKSSLDIGKITELISENGEAIGKITEGISELMDNKNNKKSSKKTKTTKTKKSSSSKDSLSTVIDIAGTILKNK